MITSKLEWEGLPCHSQKWELTVKKCVGFQTRICKTLTVMVRVIVVELVVVEKSFDNGKGSGSKSAVPFTDTLIDLDKWVIRVLLGRKKINTSRAKMGPWTVIM